MTRTQYDAVERSAIDKAEKLLRREVTERTKYKSGKVDTIETFTVETFPNGDLRLNSVTKRADQVAEKLQLINFGKYEYRKEGDADWVKRCFRDCSPSESSGKWGLPSGTEPAKVEEHFETPTDINGQKGTFYLYYRVYQLDYGLDFFERKFWVDSNGLIQKIEYTESGVLPTNKTTKETITYECNPKDVLAIEPPIK
jgi:hypothetical protein